MKLTFRIQYRTVWGEYLCVILNEEVIELSTNCLLYTSDAADE